MKWKLIGTHILSESSSMYAKMIPGVEYGIIYNKSVIFLKSPKTCIEPNNKPDIIINSHLLLKIFFILCLKINSSTIGAYITAEKKIYKGLILNVSLITCSLDGISLVTIKLINKLLTIIINNPISQYFIYLLKYLILFFFISLKSLLNFLLYIIIIRDAVNTLYIVK